MRCRYCSYNNYDTNPVLVMFNRLYLDTNPFVIMPYEVFWYSCKKSVFHIIFSTLIYLFSKWCLLNPIMHTDPCKKSLCFPNDVCSVPSFIFIPNDVKYHYLCFPNDACLVSSDIFVLVSSLNLNDETLWLSLQMFRISVCNTVTA